LAAAIAVFPDMHVESFRRDSFFGKFCNQVRAIRVLLVDDSAAFLDAAVRFLNSLPGVEIVARAASAAEGLARAAALRPDLVLMDVVMPGMNGLMAVRLVKQGVDAPKTVILTLHDTEAYRSAAKAAGADGFIAKVDFVVELPRLLESLFLGWRR